MRNFSPQILCLLLMSIPQLYARDTAVVDTAGIADSLSFQVQDVVVTGTRYGKKIIDIPYPVYRINMQEFRFARKAGVNDVLGAVPGVFLQSRYGNHDVRIAIRGFGSRSNSGIRGVRVLLDGIPESEPDGQTRIEAIDFNSVGRIEIVKGNASSLYPNAPGGVINFINELDFERSFLIQFNDMGSYNLRRNGFKLGLRSPAYSYLLTYSYHHYGGYRAHSSDYWHIVNSVLETRATDRTRLQLLGYFVSGEIRLPGSLTGEQFAEDPFQAGETEESRDFRRLSRKGRLGIRFETALDRDKRHEIEVTGYGTIKYFERPSRSFRIINRYGVGLSARYVNRGLLFGRKNELSFGGDLLNQTGPVERYENIAGRKGDNLRELTDNTIANVGGFIQNNLSLLPGRLDLLLTGRYDKMVFDEKDQLLASRSARRRFEAFTPKAALNLKLSPLVALYGSMGRSFESPAGNELDNFPTSTRPGIRLNPDLKSQESTFYELGIKGNVVRLDARLFHAMFFEATVFRYHIDNEIVPFEVFTEFFFRNSAKTRRNGFELGGWVDLYHGLHLELAYTFSDFVYEDYQAQITNLDLSTSTLDFSGNTVPSVPRYNLSVSLSRSIDVTDDVAAFIKGNIWSVSGLYVDDQNSDKTASFTLLNLMAGLDLFKTFRYNLLLSGGVNNLGDVTHVAFVNINSTTGSFYELGAPRNFFTSVKLGVKL